MLLVFLLILAYGMIWVAWGFWAFLATILIKLFVKWVSKPQSSYQTNWGAIVADLVIIIVGIGAVFSKWHEPVYTAAAVVITLVFIALELKS